MMLTTKEVLLRLIDLGEAADVFCRKFSGQRVAMSATDIAYQIEHATKAYRSRRATKFQGVDSSFRINAKITRQSNRRGATSALQYFFSATAKAVKFPTGHEVGELSRTSQCM